MFTFLRPVRFAEVDAARLVFFAKYAEFVHDALETLLGALDGGYPTLTGRRDTGIPTVHLATDFMAPLRYGDTARIETVVERLGTTSVTFRHRIVRVEDGVACAAMRHVIVTARMSTLAPVAIPDDVRALLHTHLEPQTEPGS